MIPITALQINLAPSMISRLVFICDGNKKVGFGHLSRCLTMAGAMSENVPEIYFYGDLNTQASDRVDKAGFSILGALNLDDCTAVIVDCYKQTESSLFALKKQSANLLVVDDFDSYRFEFIDLIINARVGAEKFVNSGDKHILGAQFFPFSPHLKQVRENKLQRVHKLSKITNVLLIIGASDRFFITDTLLNAIDQILIGAQITVLAGSKPNVALKHNTLCYRSFVNNIAEYYNSHDVVINGGGAVKYESGFCLLPNAAISQTTDQRDDTIILAEQKLCFDLGLAEEINVKELMNNLKTFLSDEELKMQLKHMRQYYNTGSLEALVKSIEQVLDV